jgi:myo-inositol-1(or 4)-monophosphatase
MEHKEFALGLASQAGALIRKNFSLHMKSEWKSDNTPVTETDLIINQMVIDGVKRNYPGHAVLAEEGSMPIEGAEYVWVCDPVDGTIPFSHGIPTCVFALALVHDGKPILGVLYDPFMERMLVAEKGKGALLNGKSAHVSSSPVLARNVINFETSTTGLRDLLPLIPIVKREGAKVVVLCTVLYAGLLVASGEMIATFHIGTKAHDAAALKIILEEAGGRMTDLDGNEQRYDRAINGYIASNGLVHEQLLGMIRKL